MPRDSVTEIRLMDGNQRGGDFLWLPEWLLVLSQNLVCHQLYIRNLDAIQYKIHYKLIRHRVVKLDFVVFADELK